MDAYEATRIVFSRIQSLDPENATKIMGLLLIQDHGEKEMIRLAFGPEALVHSVVLKARKDLGLLPASTPPSPSPFSRQNSSSRLLAAPGSGLPSPSSPWAAPPVFSRTNSSNGDDHLHNGGDDDLNISAAAAAASYGIGSGDLIDDFHLQDQLSFLNDSAAVTAHKTDLFYDVGGECRSPSSNGSDLFLYGGAGVNVNWAGGQHRRSCSVADVYLNSEAAAGFGWKPCMYFARGYCKNGSSCRFQHGLPDDPSSPVAAAMAGSKMDAMVEQQCQELLLRSKSQRIGGTASSQQLMAAAAAAAAFPYAAASAPSPTSTGKCMNFLFQQQQQQQNESQQRAAAAAAVAAALMLGGGEEQHKFFGRTRMDRYDYAGLVNPGSRQIYLTFPADSTFREEDVSNYFSIYGPVQDVRIPYQQKRMFGFVTFVYPETVKLILAKGNPHFVCDARVLVKPYKEKGKVPDKKQQQQLQSADRGDFSGCSTPTGLESNRDYPFDLQQLVGRESSSGARMLYSSNSQEVLLRRKLEEQQQAAELQQAIELQGRRFMGLQLLDLKNRNFTSSLSSPSPISTPTTNTTPTTVASSNSDDLLLLPPSEDKCSSPVTAPGGEQLSGSHAAVNTAGDGLESAAEGSLGKGNHIKEDNDFQESAEHNLPDSPFASPTEGSFMDDSFSLVSEAEAGLAPPPTHSLLNNGGIITNNINNSHLIGRSPLLPATPSLDMASIKSCFFQMPRFSSGHGAVGM